MKISWVSLGWVISFKLQFLKLMFHPFHLRSVGWSCTILNITLILQSDDFETWVNFKIALDIHVLNENTRISHYSTIMKSLIFSAALDTLDLF